MLTNVRPSQNLSQRLKLTRPGRSPSQPGSPWDRAYSLGLRGYVLPLEGRDKGRDEKGGTDFHFPYHPAHSVCHGVSGCSLAVGREDRRPARIDAAEGCPRAIRKDLLEEVTRAEPWGRGRIKEPSSPQDTSFLPHRLLPSSVWPWVSSVFYLVCPENQRRIQAPGSWGN